MIKRKTYLPLAAVAALALATAGCGGGGGSGPATDGMDMMEPMPEPMPVPEPDPQAVARAIELVARWNVKDDDGNNISGFWRREPNNHGHQEHLNHSRRNGSSATPVISYDANGPQLNVTTFGHGTQGRLQYGHFARANRFISTNYIGRDAEGVTTSREVIADHPLGSEWHVEKLTKEYENTGTLTVDIATDVQSTDGAADQWETATNRAQNILLDGAPAIPPDRDFLVVWIPDGDTIDGSLSGAEGSFACANANGCAFIIDRGEAGFTAFDDDTTFTPDGGTAQPVTPISPGPTVAADYLALGYWLYVPEDVTAADDYDFGVFASGGDPFEVTNLAGLNGSATYAGIVLGAYYVDASSGSPTSGLYDGSVTLNAEFGDGTETGTVTGTVSIEWSEELQSSLPSTVTLTSDNWKGNTEAYGHNYTYDMYETVRGENNIFDTEYSPDWVTDPAPWRGGHVLGFTQADVGGTYWDGDWQGAFFGNGASAIDHPTSIAGTFHVSDHETAGITGSFGAHKQDDQQ
ncbi:MAG: hypothetical protein OXK73_10705 [Rhodospirillaceae bacterium]|nr:hypothetical protein [Rhodospirillaceae bacterium]